MDLGVQAQLGQVIAITSSRARRLIASGARMGIGGLSTLSQATLGSTLFQQGVLAFAVQGAHGWGSARPEGKQALRERLAMGRLHDW